jgi:putative flippase GtrA
MPWRITLHLSRKAIAFFWNDPRLFLKYISVGALCALIEFSIFSVLYQMLGLPLLAANCTALGVAILVDFSLQKVWTFRARGAVGRQLHWFLFMQAISALLNNALMYLFVALLGWYAPLAKVIQIGLVFLWNFAFCKIVVFAEPGTGVTASRLARTRIR